MTKGEIIAAILDFNGSVSDLREIRQQISNRIEQAGRNLVDTEIVPAMARGETVRVEIAWYDQSTRTATIQKVNRKTITVKVDGQPIYHDLWRIRKQAIKRILNEGEGGEWI